MKRSNAPPILLLAILSWVGFGFFASIPAWILAHRALKQMDSGEVDSSDRSLVETSRMLAIINAAMSGVAFVAALVFFISTLPLFDVMTKLSSDGDDGKVISKPAPKSSSGKVVHPHSPIPKK